MYHLVEKYPGAMRDALYGKNTDKEAERKYPDGFHSGTLHVFDDENHTFHATIGDPYGKSDSSRGIGFAMDRTGFNIRIRI